MQRPRGARSRMKLASWAVALGLVASASGCGGESPAAPAGSGAPPVSGSSSAASPPSGRARVRAASTDPALAAASAAREGGMLVRGPSGDVLFLADEDRKVVRRIDLPIDAEAPSRAFDVPGRPAQVLALPAGAGERQRVAVTIRDPGLLVALEADEKGDLKEIARVALPSDAWGSRSRPTGGRSSSRRRGRTPFRRSTPRAG